MIVHRIVDLVLFNDHEPSFDSFQETTSYFGVSLKLPDFKSTSVT